MCCPRRSAPGSTSRRVRASCSRPTATRRSACRCVEHTELFKRAIGEYTDVVEQGDVHLHRPGWREPDAAPGSYRGHRARADLQRHAARARHKLWCIGPMFRHEKPQKGRYRQFYQVDVEAVGFAGPDVDAELIALTCAPVAQAGYRAVSSCRSTPWARPRAARELSRATGRVFPRAPGRASMRTAGGASQGNPLRILDSKNPGHAGAHRVRRRC